VSPVIDARENLVGVSASLTDVTARKLAEERCGAAKNG